MKVLLIDQIAKVNYKYSYSLAEALRRKGNDIILAIDQKNETENCFCKKMNLFKTDEKNIGKIKKIINYISSYNAILKEVKNEDYQVIHAQWMIFSPVDYYFLKKIKHIKKNNLKLVVTIHDILPFNQKFYDMYFHKKIYSLADNIIVQAENNVKRFEELFPELAGKEKMIPHGHFLDYAELINKKEARDFLGISEEKIVFLFFGQIKKVKGIKVLLEAYSKIFDKYPNLLLVIAGSVWKDEFTQYQEIINDTNMTNAVRTDIRYIPDEEVKYYYSASDCCVLPYLDVYQSGVVQLAYAYKKPVVATNIGAFKEVVIDNKTGYMCEVNNDEDLANKLELAIENIDNLKEMGEIGYDFIKEKFSWDKIANDIDQLYR